MTARDLIAATDTAGETSPKQRRSDLRFVRVILYFHLVAIIFWAVFSLSDMGRLQLPEYIGSLLTVRAIQIPLMLTWMVCPVLMGIAAIQLRYQSFGFRSGVVMLDVFLSAIQFLVMLPLMQ
jgi:hypothetical protein